MSEDNELELGTRQELCAMSCTYLGYTRLHRTPRVAQNCPSLGLGSIHQGTEEDVETGMLCPTGALLKW